VKALALAVVVALAACGGDGSGPQQPIAFSHEIHVGKVHVPCVDCHVGAETAAHASLPALSRCLICHMKPMGQQPNPREQAVRELAARKDAPRFFQVTRNAGHVHFSHAAHVSIVKLPCSDCHGDVATWSRPPTRPEPALTSMSACLACHRQRNAPTDCDTCHQ
jgi:c(7)-type cytochrome triheme protein